LVDRSEGWHVVYGVRLKLYVIAAESARMATGTVCK